jgi:hypothetical protein
MEVRGTTSNVLTALLSPEADGLNNVVVTETLNGPVTLSFVLPAKNEKWQYMREGYKVKAAGHYFLVSSTEEIKDQDGKLVSNVQLEEMWVEWGDMYLRYLEVNAYDQTATQLLTALVDGSYGATGLCPLDRGWTVGTVEPTGLRDLEAANLNCLALLSKVAELYKADLVFNSTAKTVNLYNAYGSTKNMFLRVDKNLLSLTRKTDYTQLCTRLIPLGKMEAWGYTDITSVNGGLMYLQDTSYTGRIIERIWDAPDIDDSQVLKDEAQKRLDEWKSPAVNYSVDFLDLREVSGYEGDAFSLGDTLTPGIYDDDLGISASVRVVKRSWNVYEPEQGSIELSTIRKYLEDAVSQQIDHAVNQAVNQTFVYITKIETKSGSVVAGANDWGEVVLTFSGVIQRVLGIWAGNRSINVAQTAGGVGGTTITLQGQHIAAATEWTQTVYCTCHLE